jgi:hypothetical protein
MSRPPKYVLVERKEWLRIISLMERVERRLDALDSQEKPHKDLHKEAISGVNTGDLGPFNELLTKGKKGV